MQALRATFGGFAFVGAVLAPAQPLDAHDFWIEPSSYRPAAGSLLELRLRVGEHFRGEPVLRDPRKIDRFLLAGPDGERVVPGRDGADPAGMVRLASPGLAIAGYRSTRSSITLEPDKFDSYLTEEGLERIIALRAQRKESRKPGREVYSRCAKSLVAVDGKAGAGHDRRLGFTLELIPEKDPYALAAGELLPVRLLLRDAPVEGALVVAIPHADPERKLKARTDAAGRVVLELPRGGVWLVKAVHMVEAPKGTGADWESLWASLTFEVPGP